MATNAVVRAGRRVIAAALLLAGTGTAVGSCPPAAPTGFVALKTSFGGVIAPTTASAQEAAVGGRRAKEAARENLGIDPAPFLIEPTAVSHAAGPSSCAFVFDWTFAPNAPDRPAPPSHVLPHELGHEMFVRYLVPRTQVDEYGGDAPDWLDEMAAIAFEDRAGTTLRRQDAARHAARDALIPLRKLLTMQHPEWAARGRAPANARTSAGPASNDTPAYYATVSALFDYLVLRTGDPRIIRVLAAEVRNHTPMERWLADNIGNARSDPTLRSLDAAIRSSAIALAASNGVSDSSDTIPKS